MRGADSMRSAELAQAIEFAKEFDCISTSSLQRKFRINYITARCLTDQMQEMGLVSEMDSDTFMRTVNHDAIAKWEGERQ